MRQLISMLGAILSLATARATTAQTPAAACQAKLTAPAPDSQVLQLQLHVTTFDTAQHLSLQHRSMIGEGVRQVMVMPRALSLDVYEAMNKDAWPTITGVYRTTLHRDGHFTQTRTVGGRRNRGLDSATVAAIAALDTSLLLPPPDSASMGNAESMDLRILILPGAFLSTRSTAAPKTPEGVTPLVRLRVPIRGASRPPYLKPGSPHPRYPFDLPTCASILLVEGCPVGALVRMPFQFSVSGD